MAFQSAPDMIGVTCIFEVNLERLQVGFATLVTGGYSYGDVQTIAGNVDSVMGTAWRPLLSVEANYIQTEARGLEFVNDQIAINTANAGAGTQGSEPLTNQNTFAIKKLSGLTGRSARGRIFWPCLHLTQRDNNENYLLLASANAIRDAVETVRATLDFGIYNAVIVSRVANGAKRPVAVPFEWVTTSYSDLRIDSQRRRMPGN